MKKETEKKIAGYIFIIIGIIAVILYFLNIKIPIFNGNGSVIESLLPGIIIIGLGYLIQK